MPFRFIMPRTSVREGTGRNASRNDIFEIYNYTLARDDVMFGTTRKEIKSCGVNMVFGSSGMASLPP